MLSCVRSTLWARAPQWEGGCRRWDARPPQCRGSRQWCAGVGRPPILPPFPSRMWAVDADQSADCLPVSGTWIICPWSIAWWWLWMWWPVIATCVDGLPLYGSLESRLSAEWLSALDPERRSPPCPASVMCAQRHEIESRCDSTLPYPSPVYGMATAVWTCPPLLQMASSPGARVKWRVECMTMTVWDDSEVVPTPVCWWRSAGGWTHRDWQMDVTSERLCAFGGWQVCVVASAQLSDWCGVSLGPPPTNQMDLEYLLFSPAPCRRGWTLTWEVADFK